MIYIVEDDADIREMEAYALKNSGFEVCAFSDSVELFSAMGTGALPELLLLDIMLAGDDGMTILRRIRQDPRTKLLPVIMVTAKTAEIEKVRCLDAGADDYITKPFGIMELVSRVRALIRRSRAVEAPNLLICGCITIDDSAHTVCVDGAPCTLTYKEYELLKLLMTNRNIVFSREKLMDRIWGFDYEGESRTVDMHIKTLRQKLGAGGSLIETVRGVGYKIGG